MKNNDELRAEFAEMIRPLMRWLEKNYHPHATIILTPQGAELVTGEMAIGRDETVDPYID